MKVTLLCESSRSVYVFGPYEIGELVVWGHFVFIMMKILHEYLQVLCIKSRLQIRLLNWVGFHSFRFSVIPWIIKEWTDTLPIIGIAKRIIYSFWCVSAAITPELLPYPQSPYNGENFTFLFFNLLSGEYFTTLYIPSYRFPSYLLGEWINYYIPFCLRYFHLFYISADWPTSGLVAHWAHFKMHNLQPWIVV